MRAEQRRESHRGADRDRDRDRDDDRRWASPWNRLGAGVSLSLVLSACAAAPMGRSAPSSPAMQEAPGAPPPPPPPEPTTLAEAQEQLQRAVRELSLAGDRDEAKKLEMDDPRQDKAGAAPVAPSAPPTEDPTPTVGGVPKSPGEAKPSVQAERGGAKDTPASRCAHACRAFQSLHRAVAAVCRLAGDPSEDCTHAREKETQLTTRVASCGCSIE